MNTYRYYSVETAPLCTIFRAIGQLFMEILHFKELGGYRKCCHECILVVYLVIDNFAYAPSEALSLYQMLNQSVNWLWRYCI